LQPAADRRGKAAITNPLFTLPASGDGLAPQSDHYGICDRAGINGGVILQVFSRVIADAYDIAPHVPPNRFAAEIVRLLEAVLKFDGAVLGTGGAASSATPDLAIDSAYVHGRDKSMLEDYAEISDQDPVTIAFLAGLSEPLTCDSGVLYKRIKPGPLQDFSRRHDLRHLLLFGEPPKGDNAARWAVFYRGTGRPFNKRDATVLHALWPHLVRARNINLQNVLNITDPDRHKRASALIRGNGEIEAADPGFREMLKVEWPDHDAARLPLNAFDHMWRGEVYRGRKIEISVFAKYGYAICSARPIPLANRLTPAERNVAERFAEGKGYKEIAIELGTSPNTVRNQISNLYQKLDIHDKASLAALVLRA
jgi:DNA-binding CsgD family transcriptional regulator